MANLHRQGDSEGIYATEGVITGMNELTTKRGSNITPEKFRSFLKILADTGQPLLAAQQVGLNDRAIKTLVNRYPEVAEAYSEAIGTAFEKIEREAYRRAVDGVDKAVYFKGEVVGYDKQYSDRLMEVMLKGFRTKNYGTDRVELTGADGGAIEVADARQALAEKLGVVIDVKVEDPEDMDGEM